MHLQLLLGLLLTLAPAGDSGSGPAAQASAPHPGSSELGSPLIVDGVPISEHEIKRLIIYGVGRPALEWRRVSALIEDEVQRRVAEGEDPARFEITDADFERLHQRRVSDFIRQFPTLDLETEIARSYSSLEWYEREMRMELRLDQVFIPDDPDLWPEITFEALRADSGDIWVDDFRESYERRANYWANELAEWEAKVAAGEDAGPEPELPPEDRTYRGILRQIVRDALFDRVETLTALDGLPPHLVATLRLDPEGEPDYVWTTDDLWEDVRHVISYKDIEDAKLFLAKIAATRNRMEREGILISPEEVSLALAEADAGFVGSPFSLHSVVVGNHQFPSLESYGMYFGLLESWKRHQGPKLAKPEEGGIPAALRTHLDRANRIMGLAQINVEILLVSAFHFPSNSWIDNGFEEARERAEWIKREYDANLQRHEAFRQRRMEAASRGEEIPESEEVLSPGDFWSILLDDHSDYWDPPPAASGPPGSAVGHTMKGRFGDRYRNDLQTMMGESPYYHFLYGHSITDHAFFRQDLGTVAGPFRGPRGYYLTRVTKRTPPSRPLSLLDGRHYDLLRDDYLQYTLIEYAEQALRQAAVVGL